MPNRRPTPPASPRAARATPDAAANAPKPRPKSTVLVIRISPEDRALVEAAAAAHELETSTWARQTVVLAAKRWRGQQAAQQAHQSPPGDPAPRPESPGDVG